MEVLLNKIQEKKFKDDDFNEFIKKGLTVEKITINSINDDSILLLNKSDLVKISSSNVIKQQPKVISCLKGNLLSLNFEKTNLSPMITSKDPVLGGS